MPSIAELLDAFTDAFNRNDLDAVMAAFADDAEYLPGDGQVHRGRAAIRAAFTPQFTGAFGAMRFDPEDRLIDETARKATLRWICRHDLSGPHGTRVAPLLRLGIRLRHGSRVGWPGVDVFHFNAAGKITGKYTYGPSDPRGPEIVARVATELLKHDAPSGAAGRG
ncbi:MAG TPA: nuclear transport factor 2 family protein [Kofleriaceae bacterium]|nr:nuclear transport factor 2 family protein [Kofleriaceae bacterium]